MSPPRRWIPVPLLAAWLVCTALGCGGAAPPPAEEEHPAPVKVVAATTVKLGEWTELLGSTQPLPNRAAWVSAAVEGHVHSVLGGGRDPGLVEGARVQAGQVIARLDDRIVQASRAKLAAQLTDLGEQKKQAQYAMDLAEIEVTRLQELSGSGGSVPLASRVELDRARIARKNAQSLQKGVMARETAVRADLEGLAAQVDLHVLRAPIAGQLGLLQVTPGQTITPGTAVAEVIDLAEIDALCYVPPHTARPLALGQPARLPGSEQPTGKVAFIAVQAQPETGNFAVKVRFPNPDLALRANALLRLRVLTQPEKERLTIPEAALLEDQEPPAVVVVRDVETKKTGEGKEEKLGKALKLQAILGVRDREHGVVELLELRAFPKPEADEKDEKEKHAEGVKEEKISLQDALFVVEGGHGLHDGDVVKVEEKPAHGKD